MVITKRRAIGGGLEGRCTVHRASPQEKWLRTQDVTADIAGNLKEAIKIVQAENTSFVTMGPPTLQMTVQATESKRKAALKKALNKLGRALNQVSTLELYTADLGEDMQTLQNRLEASEVTEMEMSARIQASTSTVHERVEHYKMKMQEMQDSLQHEENRRASLVKELQAARILADHAREDQVVVKELRGLEQEHGPKQSLKLAAREEDLRAENENLKKQITSLKEKEAMDIPTDAALKSAAANAERYREVVAKVTADNMVFLMKLKRSETALSSAQEKLGVLQKERSNVQLDLVPRVCELHFQMNAQQKIDSGRAQWLEEASSEIQEVIRTSLSKAENCEAKLQLLQRRQAKIDEEWQEKLVAANEKLAQITASRNWLEKNLMEATEKYRILEDEKSKLVQRYETECRHRQHAEAESRALISTLRKTNEELAEVNLALGTSIKGTEVQRSCVLEKEKEIKKILADLDKANYDLETQKAVNAALMKRKEEVEWELMTVEAKRIRLQQNMSEKK